MKVIDLIAIVIIIAVSVYLDFSWLVIFALILAWAVIRCLFKVGAGEALGDIGDFFDGD